jgi:nucleotidyltransferase substrate binding protein (TIGR01987 family)
MMSMKDIRWEQRFSNYQKALSQLEQAVAYIRSQKDLFQENVKPSALDNLIRQGLIQSFEYTHELAWKVIKDYAAFQGNPAVSGSRDAAREAFEMGLISNGHVWMEMIRSRNETSHTYNAATAEEIYLKIVDEYLFAFIELNRNLEARRNL